jgi:hypothetical protein
MNELLEKKQKKEEILKRIKDREVEDLKKLLSIPEGRRYIWKLMSSAGVFRTSFTGNSTTFFNEGKREIGLMVISEVMAASPTAFAQMQNEFTNEQKKISKQMEKIDE